MLISQVIQRLQELQAVMSDVEVLVQSDTGEPLHEYTIDIHIADNGVRSIMISRTAESKEVLKSTRRSNR